MPSFDDMDSDEMEDDTYKGEVYVREFQAIIELCSGRVLSFDSEVLKAITGFLSVYERTLFPVFIIQGLHYQLCRSLAWYFITPQKAQKREGFPSWM
jgi:hypothetical protein